MLIWPLFGTTNQLLAGLTLTLVTLYLKQRRLPTLYTAIPAVFVMTTTLIAMVGNLQRFYSGPEADTLLAVTGTILLGLGVWLLVETALALRRDDRSDVLDIDLDASITSDATGS